MYDASNDYPGESFGLELNPCESELFRAFSKSIPGPIRKTFYISYQSIRLYPHQYTASIRIT